MKTNSENRDLILQKISHFCAYRERCTSEVKEKLKVLGCNIIEIDDILEYLYNQKFVDDGRYAKLFAESKLRINKWGKIKIISALKQKYINDKHIKIAVDSLNNNDYLITLNKIIEKKINELKINEFNNAEILKILNYALQKGFEKELIMKILFTFTKS